MTTFERKHFSIHSGQIKSGAWLLEAVEETERLHEAARPKFEPIPSKGLDALGFSQRKLNGNFMSWMDDLSDRDKEEGGLWYPTGNDWGHHMAELHGRHPDKVFGVMSKMSPQRDWYANLGDAHNIASNYGHNPGGIVKPGGISGTDNLRQSLRVMDAEDHPDAIDAAFLGTKNVGGKPVPRTPRDLPKTHDFYTALRDPEAGGAFNHAAQPAVADSWMSRAMMWSKDRWNDAQNGGKPLTWPGQGTGEGLDKHLPVKKPNPETGKWEVVGSKPPTARDVAARVIGLGGGYGRMRQAMQNGAAQHGMPFAHGAQAAVWKSISGNDNPDPNPQYGDLSEIQHDPAGLWNEQWARRASGLHVPVDLDRTGRRTAAHGSFFDIHGPEDSLDEGWGGPEDISAILRHIAMAPPGWDHWEGRPGLISLGPAGGSGDSPAPPRTEDRSDQRMGPHPHEAALNWEYDPHGASAGEDGHQLRVRSPWGEWDTGGERHSGNPYHEWRHTGPDGSPWGMGLSDDDQSARDAAEASHRSFTRDLDTEQDPFDPRMIGAALDWKQYQDSFTDQAGISPDSDFLTATHPAGGNPTSSDHYWINQEYGKPNSWEVEHHPPGVEPGGQIGDVYPGFPSREDAMDWADKRHPAGAGWSPESDPFDPRQFGASRWYVAEVDGQDVPLTVDKDDEKGKAPATGAPMGVAPGMNQDLGDLPMPSGGAIVHHVVPGGGMGSGGGGGSGMPGSTPATGGGPPVSYTPSQGVDQWKSQVELGLQRNGLPVSLENQVLKQMQTESSGNPNAINNVDDNAKAGHPSQGLLQTIPSTFQQHHLPGDSNSITDPQANIDSAIGYAKERYGPGLMNSQGQGMGSGHGY